MLFFLFEAKLTLIRKSVESQCKKLKNIYCREKKRFQEAFFIEDLYFNKILENS